MPPVLRDIKLRARITSHTSRISIHSQPIPSELTSTQSNISLETGLVQDRPDIIP